MATDRDVHESPARRGCLDRGRIQVAAPLPTTDQKMKDMTATAAKATTPSTAVADV
jgi:hypothetical protein